MEDDLIAILFSLGFAGIGGLALVAGWLHVRRTAASVDWPQAEGRVTRSELVEIEDSFQPAIEFEYEVEGRLFPSSRVSFHHNWGPHDVPLALVARYPAGARVRVHYDPRDPAEAVLEPGIAMRSYLPALIRAIFFWIGCGLLLGHWLGME